MQKRIASGEVYDLIIMAAPAIDDFITSGKVVPGIRVDLASSGVGMAVRAGARKPDISSTETFKKTLLAAKAIGYSSGPSGVYLAALVVAPLCSSVWSIPRYIVWQPVFLLALAMLVRRRPVALVLLPVFWAGFFLMIAAWFSGQNFVN